MRYTVIIQTYKTKLFFIKVTLLKKVISNLLKRFYPYNYQTQLQHARASSTAVDTQNTAFTATVEANRHETGLGNLPPCADVTIIRLLRREALITMAMPQHGRAVSQWNSSFMGLLQFPLATFQPCTRFVVRSS